LTLNNTSRGAERFPYQPEKTMEDLYAGEIPKNNKNASNNLLEFLDFVLKVELALQKNNGKLNINPAEYKTVERVYNYLRYETNYK